MVAEFADDGIRFQYPENWSLERQENETGWTVSVQSPGTAFLVVSCDSTMPTTEEVLEATLEALRSDYPGLGRRLRRFAGRADGGRLRRQLYQFRHDEHLLDSRHVQRHRNNPPVVPGQ